MKLKMGYWVNGHEEFTHEMELLQGYKVVVDLPRDKTPELMEHHISIKGEEA